MLFVHFQQILPKKQYQNWCIPPRLVTADNKAQHDWLLLCCVAFKNKPLHQAEHIPQGTIPMFHLETEKTNITKQCVWAVCSADVRQRMIWWVAWSQHHKEHVLWPYVCLCLGVCVCVRARTPSIRMSSPDSTKPTKAHPSCFWHAPQQPFPAIPLQSTFKSINFVSFGYLPSSGRVRSLRHPKTLTALSECTSWLFSSIVRGYRSAVAKTVSRTDHRTTRQSNVHMK